MIDTLLVALGGALGASSRYLLSLSMKSIMILSMPMATLCINFIGCFCIGVIMAQYSDFKAGSLLFVVIGFLGSFTTMSAFSQQTIELLYNGREYTALIYIILSIGSCLVGTMLAYSIFKTS